MGSGARAGAAAAADGRAAAGAAVRAEWPGGIPTGEAHTRRAGARRRASSSSTPRRVGHGRIGARRIGTRHFGPGRTASTPVRPGVVGLGLICPGSWIPHGPPRLALSEQSPHGRFPGQAQGRPRGGAERAAPAYVRRLLGPPLRDRGACRRNDAEELPLSIKALRSTQFSTFVHRQRSFG